VRRCAVRVVRRRRRETRAARGTQGTRPWAREEWGQAGPSFPTDERSVESVTVPLLSPHKYYAVSSYISDMSTYI
jgi:hypothetical protein